MEFAFISLKHIIFDVTSGKKKTPNVEYSLWCGKQLLVFGWCSTKQINHKSYHFSAASVYDILLDTKKYNERKILVVANCHDKKWMGGADWWFHTFACSPTNLWHSYMIIKKHETS